MRIALCCLFLGLGSAFAQESPSPTASTSPIPSSSFSPTPPSIPERKIELRFALPPLEGTISLGIFDHAGKLVRVLHREDSISEFTAGTDALETTWDGTDDNGNALSNGKYHARGFVVGDLKVEGIDYFFNDWVTDENSPHIKSLGVIKLENGELELNVDVAGGRTEAVSCDPTTGSVLGEITRIAARQCGQTDKLLVAPVDCAEGREGTTWFIDSPADNSPREVKQLSKEHELLRRLPYAASDPQPQHLAASPNDEKIFLVEQNDQLQRLRGLGLVRTTKESPNESVSDWKPLFEKKIVAHQNFGLEDGKPAANPGKTQNSPPKIDQKLRPDPLQKDRAGKVELAVGIDSDGSYLETADGLPLRTISDTPNLTRVLLARPNDNAIDAFQDDGAVVEQFRVSNLAEMIAFDCGDFELK
jgi:hypothetical protein